MIPAGIASVICIVFIIWHCSWVKSKVTERSLNVSWCSRTARMPSLCLLTSGWGKGFTPKCQEEGEEPFGSLKLAVRVPFVCFAQQQLGSSAFCPAGGLSCFVFVCFCFVCSPRNNDLI